MPRAKKADSNRKPPPDEMKGFPMRLRKAIKASPLTRPEIAEESGVDNPTLGRWMKGEGWQGAEGHRFVKLALVLDVSLDWLLAGKPEHASLDDGFAVLFEDSERGDRAALNLDRRIQVARKRLDLSADETLASDDG